MLPQDIRYALRTLFKSPGFSVVAILSLALGIGANTAIFSLIDAMVLRHLPVTNPEGLYILGDPAGENHTSHGSQQSDIFSYPTYKHLRERNTLFSELFAAGRCGHVDLTLDGKPAPGDLSCRLVSGTYFPLLGVRAELGRTLTPEDDKLRGGHPVVVISDRFWHERLGGSPDVLGPTIGLNGRKYTVIGVTAPEFFGEIVGQSPDLWVPMAMQEQIMPGRPWLDDVHTSWLQVMARLKPGVSEQQARAATEVLWRQILIDQEAASARPDELRELRKNKYLLTSGAAGFSRMRADFSEPLFILMTVVALVLLIACSNVANLLLARATGRQREIGIRIALGAGRVRLVRQLLTESVLLSLAGAAVGLLFAEWGSHALLLLVNGKGVPLDIRLDVGVLTFTAAVAVFTGVLFGLIPALRGTKIDISAGLKETSRGLTASGSRLSFGKMLVVAQVALSLLLLVGAGLFVRSLLNLEHVQLGYEPDHLLMMNVDATASGYKGERAQQFWRNVLERISQIPGVKAVTLSQNGLFSGSESGTLVQVAGFTAANDNDAGSAFDQVAPNYFEAVGIPIVKGRGFTERDNAAGVPVTIINQSFARFYFHDRDPIGQHMSYFFDEAGHKADRQIIGVAADVRDHSLKNKIDRRFYLSMLQPFDEAPVWGDLEIRTRADPNAIASAARSAIRTVDASVPVTASQPLKMNLEDQLRQEHLMAQLSAFFSGLALLLAAIGLYGVMSYAIARRTSEIGLRMALGAKPERVLWMVLRESLMLVVLGLGIGVPIALALSRLIASRLFGVQSWDPVTLAGSAVVLLVIATVAAFLPALRAARLNPVIALHYE